MGKIAKYSRRAFLIGSTAVVGGVAFGVYKYKQPLENPLLDDLAEGEAAITPYVKIDQTGITLITPRADKGQGAYSIQAHLLAEELDVDPHKVQLSPGKPSRAYYNGRVMDEGFPFPATDQSDAAEQMRAFGAALGRTMGMQMTGGSSTVPDGFDKLRNAGAVARETLKAAAANKSGTDIGQLKTEDGHVLLPDGSKLSYESLAVEASSIEPVQEVKLRDASEWKYLGKPQKRVDIVAKSTGTEKYGIDLMFEGMLNATVRANPGIGGDVAKYDASAAEKMRGVKKILPVEHGVAVIADNTWRAIQAANAIDIEWGEGPYPASSEEMWKVLDENLVPGSQDNQEKNLGDVDAALSDGDTLEVEYRTPYLAHAPLEPMNAIVKVDGGRVDIWTGTQIPRFIQDHVSGLAGVGVDDVHVHVQPMGGSFGRRLEDTYVLQAVEVAMAVEGTPVKMTWSREEDMAHDYPRTMALAKGRGKVVDGKVDSYDLSICSPSTAASWFGRLMGAPPGPDLTITAGAWDQPFDIPNYRVTGYRAPEMVPISSWRSVGASGNGFLHESLFDELIHKAGADPMDERIRLCNHDVSRTVLETLKELSDWNGHKPGENQGRGVAFTVSFGVPMAQVIDVTASDGGISIDRVFAVCDVGKVLDPINFEAQVTGGIIFGLGHAMNCELTYENYAPQQTNFHAFQGMRIHQAPEITVKGLENADKIRGIGEPGVPPAAPALANAIFAATGQRIRELPLNKQVSFI